MAQRVVLIPGIGEVTLVKRRGSSHLRLSVTANGQVRVGMPSWTPYVAGIAFAKSRQDWITAQLNKHPQIVLSEGNLIGKAHRLHFNGVKQPLPKVKTKMSPTSIEITTHLAYDSAMVQEKAQAASERALKTETVNLLVPRLASLATQHNLTYKDVKVRKLTSRWGSCSSDKTITLSYYLIQLPWPLIDYVLLHELTHTVHLHHGADFWNELERLLPSAKKISKEIKHHKPRIEPA
ncbi:M48 family metallopeptidase [Candidatus Saccharibacteria bacterium]|nr:M48 family metallopeptidase [Candidatus Saccharibacteria bacterium]